MPRRLLGCLALGVLLAACPGPAPSASDAGAKAPDAAVSTLGDERLRASDLTGARDAFRADLAARPADAHAAFGAALTQALMLPDDDAVTALLDLCALPHVDVAHQVFGKTGILAQDSDARAGTATLTTGRRQGDSGDFAPIAFAPQSVRTTVQQVQGRVGIERHLFLRIEDVSFAGGRQAAELDVDVDWALAVRDGTGATAPLANGLSIAAADFAGALSFSQPSANGLVWEYFYRPVAGSLTFNHVGTGAVGDAVDLTFNDLVLEGQPSTCDPSCTSEDWPYLRVSGTVADAVSAAVKLKLPLDDVKEDTGSPHRTALVVLIDRCPTVSAEMLRGQLANLLTSVEKIDANLQVVVKDPNAEAFQFRVPGSLFFVAGEIPLNITDVRLAKTAVDALVCLGRGATQYRTLAKRFADLLGTYEFWTDAAAGPQSRAERTFVVRLLVDELNQVFLDREPGFSLTAASSWLVASLDAGSAALTRVPKNSGLFNFQVLNAKDFAADLDNQLTFLRTSLSTAGPRGFPHSPDYLLSLKTLLDSPIDIQSLHQASQNGTGVFLFHDGVPGALPAASRNDWWELDTAAATKALVPVFALPPDQTATSCSLLSPCPGRYFCQPDAVGLLSHCQTPGFLFLDKATLKRALPSTGDPAFLDMDALRPLRVLQ